MALHIAQSPRGASSCHQDCGGAASLTGRRRDGGRRNGGATPSGCRRGGCAPAAALLSGSRRDCAAPAGSATAWRQVQGFAESPEKCRRRQLSCTACWTWMCSEVLSLCRQMICETLSWRGGLCPQSRMSRSHP